MDTCRLAWAVLGSDFGSREGANIRRQTTYKENACRFEPTTGHGARRMFWGSVFPGGDWGLRPGGDGGLYMLCFFSFV